MFYWMLEWKRDLLDPGITQRLLCHGTRYQFVQPSGFLDNVIGTLLFLLPLQWRVATAQSINGYTDRLFRNLVRALHEAPRPDPPLTRRLQRFLSRDGVSHLMMSFASIGPLALAARKGGNAFEYLLTFQGDEEFAECARRAGLLEQYQSRLADAIAGSAWPAVVISHDYQLRIEQDMGVPATRLQVIYNGVHNPDATSKPDIAILRQAFPELADTSTLVSYVGRQEPEKGLDLLLYAAKLLESQGVAIQLVVCGSTAKGSSYKKIIAVVCPSVNREPFGLVATEAMAYGAPVLVPEYGGIAEVIRAGDQVGGLTFKTWDSGHLARQLGRLLRDDALHAELAANARRVAAAFTDEKMADRILAHLGIPLPTNPLATP